LKYTSEFLDIILVRGLLKLSVRQLLAILCVVFLMCTIFLKFIKSKKIFI